MSSWYALRLKPLHEFAAARLLDQAGVEVFLPTYTRRSVWSDRIKKQEVPLFSGYMFASFEQAQKSRILSFPSVLYIVGTARRAEPVNPEEVASLRKAVASGAPLLPYHYLRAGDEVEVAEGPLAGLKGCLVRIKNNDRLVVSVTILQRSVLVELERDTVTAIRAARRRHDEIPRRPPVIDLPSAGLKAMTATGGTTLHG